MHKLFLYYLTYSLIVGTFISWGLFVGLTGIAFLSGGITFNEARKISPKRSMQIFSSIKSIRLEGGSIEKYRQLTLGMSIYLLVISIFFAIIYNAD